MYIICQLCILIFCNFTSVVSINEVASVRFETSSQNNAETSGTITVTLWHNFTIYQYIINGVSEDTTYTETSPDILGLSDCPKPKYNNTAETKIMIQNSASNGIYIDKIRFDTISGDWFGITSICILSSSVPDGWLNEWEISDSVCGTGYLHYTDFCVDTQSYDCAPSKQVLHFDTSSPNQLTPTRSPTYSPTKAPTSPPTVAPTIAPTIAPTSPPTHNPTLYPTNAPTNNPTSAPSMPPTNAPTLAPTTPPTNAPTFNPTNSPTDSTESPTSAPTYHPTFATESPSTAPTMSPTNAWMICMDNIECEYIAEITFKIKWSVTDDEFTQYSSVSTFNAISQTILGAIQNQLMQYMSLHNIYITILWGASTDAIANTDGAKATADVATNNKQIMQLLFTDINNPDRIVEQISITMSDDINKEYPESAFDITDIDAEIQLKKPETLDEDNTQKTETKTNKFDYILPVIGAVVLLLLLLLCFLCGYKKCNALKNEEKAKNAAPQTAAVWVPAPFKANIYSVNEYSDDEEVDGNQGYDMHMGYKSDVQLVNNKGYLNKVKTGSSYNNYNIDI